MDESVPAGLAISDMPQQRYVRIKDDDWTGVTGTAERRRLQNRLNQRAYRHRKQAEKGERPTLGSPRRVGLKTATSGEGRENAEATEAHDVVNKAVLFGQEGHKMLCSPQVKEMVLNFTREAYQNYSLGMTRPSQLHALIKLNVLNAFARNATLLGIPTHCLCADEAISPFSLQGPVLSGATSWPESLRPTTVQLSVRHHPWIDLIPFPVMRNRVLLAIDSGILDEDEFCENLMEVDSDRTEKPSLIVWGESSDPGGWEATLLFFEKYGWLVWACPEIIESTNFWRTRRGEKPFF